ncbi:PIP-CTERM sorting domain-containing protein, partial [Methanocaldococcus sp.]
IYPICWMGVNSRGIYSTYTASSATLDYLVVGDVGNTIYNIIPISNDMNTFFKSYDPKNHIVELYSKIINKEVTLKLKQKIHYDVIVHATETNTGIRYSYLYTYGTPVLVFWNFGDGSYSLDPNPVHYYNGDNEYQASVMIIDENGVVSVGFGPVVQGNRIVNSMLYVEPTVVQPNQTVNIYYINPSGYTYLNLYFEDWNKNYITNKIKDTLDPKPDYYIYNYYNIIGVGYDVSNIKNLTISFKIPWEGIYYVEGKDSVLHSFAPRMIKVIDDKPPIAKLYVYPNPAYSSESVYFNPLNSYDPDANRVLNNSGGYIISPNEPAAKIYGFNLTVYNSSGGIVWRYTSNSLKIVSHRFDPGNYTAKLVVWDGFGKRGESEVNFTVIYKIYGLKPDFDYKYIGNYTMEFIDTSIVFPGSIIKRIWNFGDGSIVETNNLVVEHKYNKSGFYLVTLTVFTNTNLKGSISKIVYVPESQILYPKADFTFKVLNNLTVIFNASSSYSPNGNIVKYIWNFGDNSSLTSNNPIVEHKYNKPGIYLVTLTVVDNKGLSDSCGKYVNVNNENILSIPIPLYVKLLVMVITLLSIFMISKWLK